MLDPSISLNAKPPEAPNPLAQIGQYAQLGNALTGLQQNQQTLAARQAIADAYRNTPINPATGRPDSNALLKTVLSGPGAYLAPDVIQQQQEQALHGYAINQAQLAQVQNRMNAVNGVLTPLMRLGQNVTPQDIYSAVAGLHNAGIPTDEILHDMGTTMPVNDPAHPDPAYGQKLQAWVVNHAARAWSPELQAQMFTPHPTAVDNGGNISFPDLNPQTNPTAIGMQVAKTMTPEGAAHPVSGPPGPNGQPTQIPAGTFAAKQGFGFLVPGGGPSPLGTGRLPDALRNPANAAAAAPAPQATGIGPAEQASLVARGAHSQQAFQDISNQGVQARNQSSILGTMLADANQFTTGPQFTNNLRAWAVRNGAALGTSFGLDANKVAANESFDKLANQIADAQGAGSDARLSVIQHANPSSALSPQGVGLIIRQLQGNADYLQARAQLAAKYPDQSDRAGFEANVGAHLDPRAFQFARMTPQQKAEYAKSLSKPDLDALRNSYNWAVNNHLIGGAGG